MPQPETTRPGSQTGCLSAHPGAKKPNCAIVATEQCIAMVYTEELQKRMAGFGEFCQAPISTDSLLRNPTLIENTEILCTTWGAPQFDERLLAAAPRLRAILHAAGSVRPLVSDTLWERDLLVSSAYEYNSIPVSEFTLGAILLANKRAFHHMRALGNKAILPDGEDLISMRNACVGNYNSVVGLVSFGSVARLVRERLRPFDLKVLVYDPFLDSEEAKRMDVVPVDLDELFASADVVSLHTPLLDTTLGMICGKHFTLMKQGASFINTARGALIREHEMVDVLRKRPDLQVLLDVTWPEPVTSDSQLYTLPNVYMTPHIAGSLAAECHRLGGVVADELRSIAEGKPLRWRITRELLEKMA